MTRYLKKTDSNGDERWDIIKMLLAALCAVLLAYFGWLGIVAVGAASQQDVKDVRIELQANHAEDIKAVYHRIEKTNDEQTSIMREIQKDIREMRGFLWEKNEGY